MTNFKTQKKNFHEKLLHEITKICPSFPKDLTYAGLESYFNDAAKSRDAKESADLDFKTLMAIPSWFDYDHNDDVDESEICEYGYTSIERQQRSIHRKSRPYNQALLNLFVSLSTKYPIIRPLPDGWFRDMNLQEILDDLQPVDKIKTNKKYRYSEIFGQTIQGEGVFTGVPTVWLRVWGCNFECRGFGQDKPEDPSTYDLDFLKIDPSAYKTMEELPVFHRGCDSSYSWAKKFSHLAHQDTAADICTKIEAVLPSGKFKHPKSGQWHHMAFTGGEPMMSQTAIVDVMENFAARGNIPKYVTIETNGTQKPRPAFENLFIDHAARTGGELFWSVSPKLYLSGELWDNAIKPENLALYKTISDHGQLKYVSNGTDRSWDEVERATDLYRKAGIDWDVWIMPVGADREMQESHQARIAEQAVERGYNVAARVHTWIFGNVIGK